MAQKKPETPPPERTVLSTIGAEALPRRLPELGKIKIGGKGPELPKRSGQGTWRRPVKFDSFVVTSRERGSDDNFLRDAAVHADVGDKPVELAIRLLFDRPEENFFSQFVEYQGRTCVLRCDGTTCQNQATGEVGDCTRQTKEECQCKPYGRLPVMLEAAPFIGAFYTFRTTSWETIRNISSTLELLYGWFGSVMGLPLTLKMYPAEVTYTSRDGERHTGKAYKVALVQRGSFEALQKQAIAAQEVRELGRKQLALLAAGTSAELEEIDAAEVVDIADEFFPPEDGEGGETVAVTEPAVEAEPERPVFEPTLTWLDEDSGYGLWQIGEEAWVAFLLPAGEELREPTPSETINHEPVATRDKAITVAREHLKAHPKTEERHAAEPEAEDGGDEAEVAFIDQQIGFGKKVIKEKLVAEYTWRELAEVNPGYIGWCLANVADLKDESRAEDRAALSALLLAVAEADEDAAPTGVETPEGSDALNGLDAIESAPGYYRAPAGRRSDGEALYDLYLMDDDAVIQQLGSIPMTVEDVDFTARQHAKNAAELARA